MLAKRKIPVDLDPGELQSIKSYQIEKDQEQKESEETSEPPKKKAKIAQKPVPKGQKSVMSFFSMSGKKKKKKKPWKWK